MGTKVVEDARPLEEQGALGALLVGVERVPPLEADPHLFDRVRCVAVFDRSICFEFVTRALGGVGGLIGPFWGACVQYLSRYMAFVAEA